jgi:carbamoyltransferase
MRTGVSMKVLGYNGGLDGYPARFNTGHDSAAALVIDGEVVAACEEERFTREKHTGRFPRRAIEWCLREAGLRSLDELDLVTYYYSYPLMFSPEKLAQNRSKLALWQRAVFGAANRAMTGYNRLADYSNRRSRHVFDRQMGTVVPEKKWKAVPHHLCHAASTFYDSPWERALCLTLDAEGESASAIAAVARGTTFKIVRELFAPNSLGYLYAYFTSYLGFEPHDEYKVMGLAPYGDPGVYRSFFREIVAHHERGHFEVDGGLILLLQARDALFAEGKLYPPRMTRALGPARLRDEPVTQRHMDIAAALQEALEEAVLHMLRHLRRETGERHLCLAGGVALNCSMNGRIARSGLFDGVYVHPSAHDSGTALGAALYGYHNLGGRPRKRLGARRSIYLGPGYRAEEIDAAVEQSAMKITHSKPADLARFIAAQIAAGKVVGWYQGRMEWGPRALGNRSILADARRDDMKDIVNHAVKLREGFRPFAPACLDEQVRDWFDMTGLPERDGSPYMLFVMPVADDKRERIPAVTHVDGSARVQTVTREGNPRFHALLTAFHELTGVPVVLNTSFNVKGEPIVNTPADAIRCFLNTQIDLLVLGDTVVEKRPEVAALLLSRRALRDAGRVINGQISAA